MSVYDKLLKIQSELKAPKGQRNKFGNYNYRSCEDILEALKPLLEQNKATLIINDLIAYIGNRYYVESTAKLVDVEDFSTIEAKAYAREEENKKGMDSSQITGSTSSYARKYALNGLFAIDDTKDSDSTNEYDKSEKLQSDTKNISEKQVNRLFAIAKGKGYNAESVKKTVLKKYGVTEIAKLTKQQYDSTCDGYENL